MLKIILIFICIGLLGLLLYHMSIQVKLKVIRKNENDVILIRVKTFYGALNLKFELPMLDIVFVNGKPALKYKAEVESNKTSKLFKSLSKIFSVDDFNKIKRYFRHDPVLLKRIKDYWFLHLKIRELSVILKIGLLDAAITALACGAVWSMLGVILSILLANLDLTTKNIVVAPMFDKEGFEMEISCIINFRLGDIINTGIMALKRRRELKKSRLKAESQINC